MYVAGLLGVNTRGPVAHSGRRDQCVRSECLAHACGKYDVTSTPNLSPQFGSKGVVNSTVTFSPFVIVAVATSSTT